MEAKDSLETDRIMWGRITSQLRGENIKIESRSKGNTEMKVPSHQSRLKKKC